MPAPRHPLVVAVTVAAAVAVMGTACASDPSPAERTAAVRADQLREVAERAELGDEVSEVLVLLAEGVTATYVATIETRAGDAPATRIRVTQQPPRRRIDVLDAEGRATVITLERDDEVTVCEPSGDGWSCTAGGTTTAASGFDPAAVVDAAEQLVASADRFTLRVTDDAVAGQAVRCLEAVPDGDAVAAARLCVTDDGVLALVERPGSTVEVVSYDGRVGSDAFDRPDESAD